MLVARLYARIKQRTAIAFIFPFHWCSACEVLVNGVCCLCGVLEMSRASMSHPPHRDFHGMDAVAFMRDIRNIQDSELPHIGGASPSANRLARLRRGISKPHSETSNLSDDTHKLLAVPGQGDDVMGTTRFTQMRVLEKRRQSAAVCIFFLSLSCFLYSIAHLPFFLSVCLSVYLSVCLPQLACLLAWHVHRKG